MKKYFASIVLLSLAFIGNAQNIVKIPFENYDSIEWIGEEKEYYSDLVKFQIVTNVSVPTMEVFKPESNINNGTSVIIAPGGALYVQNIESEGRDVARWLNKKGITAFVLKYRLVPSGEDAPGELMDLLVNNPLKMRSEVGRILPLSISDALNAVSYVRNNAVQFGVDSNKIGLMGFSSGGAVVLGAANYYTDENRPDFIVPVYPWIDVMSLPKPKKDTPSMFFVCSSNDNMVDISGIMHLVNSLVNLGLRPSLFMFSKGGHGFGMQKFGIPSDDWINRFYEWSVSEKLTTPIE